MQQSVVRRKPVEVKPYRKNGVKVGRWGVVKVYYGGERVQDREEVARAIVRQRSGRQV